MALESELQFETQTYQHPVQEITSIEGVEKGFRMEAFDLHNERMNLLQEVSTKEAVHTQLCYFLEEYLTNKAESVFYYTFDNDGNLLSDGWNRPMIDIYKESKFDPNVTPEMRRVREAEYNSFSRIQTILQNRRNELISAEKNIEDTYDPVVLLMSPAENYDSPYAFVSAYELKQDDNGDYYVEATNKKTFLSVEELEVTRQHLIKQGHVIPDNPREIYEHPLGEPEIAMLSDVLITFPHRVRDILNLFPTESNENRALINQQLTEFSAEIETFTNLLADRNINHTELEKYFKYFLLKAKMHFDPEWAEEQNLTQEQIALLQQSKLDNAIQSNDFVTGFGDLATQTMDIEIMIAGSCGKVGGASLKSIITAMKPDYTTSGLFDYDTSDKIFICDMCGHVHDITPAGGGLREQCDACGKVIPKCE